MSHHELEKARLALGMSPVAALCEAARGRLDLNALAKIELARRGLSQDGIGVGPERARLEVGVLEQGSCQGTPA